MKPLLYILLFVSNLVFGQTDSITHRIIDKINHYSENPVHSMLLYIDNETKNVMYSEGFGLVDKKGDSVTAHSSFKIASSTKLFVSTIILQLQEEAKLNINDKVYPYLKDLEYLDFENIHNLDGVKYAKHITIKQLLSHRSGLADLFTDREEAFFGMLMQNPKKQYSPKALMALYYQFNLHREPHFKPDEAWYYSDINFILLGLVIEQLDIKSLSQSIRHRILEPLNMHHTFFEFYETPKEEAIQVNQYVGSINFSDLNTSFDWAGGGLVSTNLDLAIFIKALFNFKLINKDSLTKMIDVKTTKENESRYGLGVYEFIVNQKVYYGHFGFYNTFVGYCPETKSTISYCISQATPDFNTHKLIRQILNFVE
ncbi:serine hydrolase domain-containing protein [Lacinutrix iliipiscaria]|uniref:Serine hydrolase domain-containing protein n=1 Tax=Lacinutrix iliipiscaria TaxID=1230532 RepID=A0ABW5WNR0_9FLAO